MKKYLLFAFFFLGICGVGYSDYCVVQDGDGVKVLYPVNRSCEEYAFDMGVFNPVHVVTLPAKEDRKYWKLSGKSVVIDNEKKQLDIAKQAQLEAEKAVILSKLKISKEEFEKLNKQKAVDSSL